MREPVITLPLIEPSIASKIIVVTTTTPASPNSRPAAAVPACNTFSATLAPSGALAAGAEYALNVTCAAGAPGACNCMVHVPTAADVAYGALSTSAVDGAACRCVYTVAQATPANTLSFSACTKCA